MYSLDQTNGYKNKGLPINGARPTPLKINKSSNPIQKRPSKRPNEPIIIYAHSPKVIHTRPQDFMALVQRLTGRVSRSSNDNDIDVDHPGNRSHCLEDLSEGLPMVSTTDDDRFRGCEYDDGGSSNSSLYDDPQKMDCASVKEEFDVGCYLVSPTMFMAPKKSSIGDIPLYTPTGIQWLSSSSYNSPSRECRLSF